MPEHGAPRVVTVHNPCGAPRYWVAEPPSGLARALHLVCIIPDIEYTMWIITHACNGCGQCQQICPVDGAIVATSPQGGGQAAPAYQITASCAECGACQHACRVQAIEEA